jgi:hypothetical protein
VEPLPDQNTPVHSITSKLVRDEWEKLQRIQITPWALLNSGKPMSVLRFDGSEIRCEGVTFDGSPRVIFWGRYIEPFIEDISFRVIDQTLALCKEKRQDARPALAETGELLKQLVRDAYNRMAEIDQRLRGKGYPQTVARRNVEPEIAAMSSFIEARLAGERAALSRTGPSTDQIPATVIGEVARAFDVAYTRAELNNLFMRAGVYSDPPPGSKLVKISEWLRQINEDPSGDALEILGKLLEDFLERRPTSRIESDEAALKEWEEPRTRILDALTARGMSYKTGGKIIGGALYAPSRSLGDLIGARDLPAVHAEFARAEANITADPPAAVTAACAILEATFRTYIAEEGLTLPAEQSIQPLWRIVQRHLGLDPSQVQDNDLKRIIGGLASIVDGVGAFRTHAGSAHGRGPKSVAIDSRHARLAVHAAHTAVTFILETWTKKHP